MVCMKPLLLVLITMPRAALAAIAARFDMLYAPDDAQRAAAFEMAIGYPTRTRRDDVPHRWFDSVIALAQWCDFLVVATPGGAATKHLIDATVLAALGPNGYLVNIARGSVVDTTALAD